MKLLLIQVVQATHLYHHFIAQKEINNNQRKHILSPATHCFNHCVFPPLSEDASLLMWGKFILCLSLRWNLQKRQS